MKILIISNSRCGSTNLMNSISSAHTIKSVFEPFINGIELNMDDDMVVKSLINQSTYEKYLELIPQFDKVIFLTRRSTLSMTESLINLINRSRDNNYDPSLNTHLDEWVYDGIEDVTTTTLHTKITKRKEELYELAKHFNISVDHYEDVFYGDKSLKDKDIKLDLTYLDTSKRLRK